MGAMPLAAASPDFIGTIQDALLKAGMLMDTIVVLDPNDETMTPYDPETDTGGTSTPRVVLGPRPAYLSSVKKRGGEPIVESGVLQGKLEYFIQFIPEPGDAIMTQGLVIRVLAGGKNPVLVHHAFQVEPTETGSIAALTKVKGKSNGALVPEWVAP